MKAIKSIKTIMCLVLVMVVLPLSVYSISPDANLEAWWKLDDTSDSSGNSWTLTEGGSIVNLSGASCNDGGCYTFDGIDDILSDGTTIGDGESALSAGGWVKFDTTSAQRYFLGKFAAGVEFSWMVYHNSAGNPACNFKEAGGSAPIVTGTGDIDDDTWHHVMCVFNGTALNLYVDGTLNNTVAMSTTIFDSTAQVALGKLQRFTNYYIGELDEQSIWTRALDDSEVLDLYQNGIVGNPVITLVNPTQAENFTFDVENTTLNISTDVSSSCTYTYNNVTTNLTTADNLSHTSFFNMGVATNSTKQFDVTYFCSDTTDPALNVTEALTFFQEGVPLNLSIFVPIDQQEFIRPINAIEFHIETNYQADCQYLVTNLTNVTNFTSTGTSIHKTNYTTLFPTIDTYPLTFFCTGTIINDSINTSITFFLIDDEITASAVLTQTTGQLPQVGSDVGGFLQNLTPSVTQFVFILAMIGVILLVIGAFVTLITGMSKLGFFKLKGGRK